MKQLEIIENGGIKKLSNILNSYHDANIFLIRGKKSYTKSGAQEAISDILDNYSVTIFHEFSVNPKLEEAKIGYQKFSKSACNLIIAIGGGSVIDMAKIIKFLYIENQDGLTKTLPPIIAIPTTAGTGSEATHFAVVYIDGEKQSYTNSFLLPNVAIVDPELLIGQSKYQMATSGIDAFAQGIESFWCVNSTKESLAYAEKAIKLVWNNLENAIVGDSNSITLMAKGSNYAGKAINITKTTGPHAVSYILTSQFKISHGHAVSLTLPEFLLYNYNVSEDDILDNRGVSFVRDRILDLCHILKVSSTIEAKKKIKALIKRIDLKISFSNDELKNIVRVMLENINYERLSNNPRKITTPQLRQLLNEAFSITDPA